MPIDIVSRLSKMDGSLAYLAKYFSKCQTRSQIDPLHIDPCHLKNIFVLEIRRDQATGSTRLYIRLTGTALDAAFSRQVRNFYLEDFIHGAYGKKVLEGFHRCANTKESIWMRQIVEMKHKAPRYVEGDAIYVSPDRIYGGLVMGQYSSKLSGDHFTLSNIMVENDDIVPR